MLFHGGMVVNKKDNKPDPATPRVYSYPLALRAPSGSIKPLPQPVKQRPPHFAQPSTLTLTQALEGTLRARLARSRRTPPQDH